MQLKLLITVTFHWSLHPPTPSHYACCRLEHSSEVSQVLKKFQIILSSQFWFKSKKQQYMQLCVCFLWLCEQPKRSRGALSLWGPCGHSGPTDNPLTCLLNHFIFYGDLSGPLDLYQMNCVFTLRNFRLLPAGKGAWAQLFTINKALTRCTHQPVHTSSCLRNNGNFLGGKGLRISHRNFQCLWVAQGVTHEWRLTIAGEYFICLSSGPGAPWMGPE